jgi:hypothetical protein
MTCYAPLIRCFFQHSLSPATLEDKRPSDIEAGKPKPQNLVRVGAEDRGAILYPKRRLDDAI